MDPDVATPRQQYVIPSRTLSGSTQEILEGLDDMIVALQLVREVVVARTPKPAHRPRRAWLERVRRALAFGDYSGASAKR